MDIRYAGVQGRSKGLATVIKHSRVPGGSFIVSARSLSTSTERYISRVQAGTTLIQVGKFDTKNGTETSNVDGGGTLVRGGGSKSTLIVTRSKIGGVSVRGGTIFPYVRCLDFGSAYACIRVASKSRTV
ncbi:hypothetical protein GOBAR_DD04151 [Gossypium barbadense]|nr:hypothetical protein GOBAR_DD04151 [Gossypium barbadense]